LASQELFDDALSLAATIVKASRHGSQAKPRAGKEREPEDPYATDASVEPQRPNVLEGLTEHTNRTYKLNFRPPGVMRRLLWRLAKGRPGGRGFGLGYFGQTGYRSPATTPEAFQRLVDAVETALRARGILDDYRLVSVALNHQEPAPTAHVAPHKDPSEVGLYGDLGGGDGHSSALHEGSNTHTHIHTHTFTLSRLSLSSLLSLSL
jgi:hypothetical protein